MRIGRPKAQQILMMATRALGNPSSTFSLFTKSSTHFRSCRYASNKAYKSFETLVKTRCKSRDLSVSEALGFFDSILETKPMTSIWTLNQLLGWLSKKKQFSAIVSTYTRLVRFRFVDFRPDVSTLTIVVKCFCQLNNVKSGFCVFGTMVKRGVGYNSHTLSALVDGLCRQSSMALAMELFERLENLEDSCNRRRGCVLGTYGTLINQFCKVREPTKALELIKKMLESNHETKPNEYFFSLVIESLREKGQMDEALSLFRTMISCGVRPDVVLYTSLVRGLDKFGQRGKAKRFVAGEEKDKTLSLFEDMVGRGIVPDISFYSALIAGLSKSGKWKEVVRVLEDMKAQGVSPNIVTVSSILDARFKEGSTVAALHLVGVMAENRLLPASLASCSFLGGLSFWSRTEEVEVLSGTIEKEEAAGPAVANVQTLGIVLNGLCSSFMMLEAREVFEKMAECGLVNDVTFGTMINGYCLQGEIDEAKEIFDQMEIVGCFPNIVVYRILANGYLKVGRIGEAFKIIKDSVVKGFRVDGATRRLLKAVHGYRREAELKNSHHSENKES